MIHTAINKKGFTLVETLFYIAGLVVLLLVISSMFFYTYNWYKRVTIGPRADHAGIVIVDTITRAIRGGETINLGQSTLNSNDGALSLTGTVELVDVTKRFSLSSGRILYEQSSLPSSYLSPNGMTVSRMYFTQLTSPVSSGIRFDVDLTYSTKEGSTTKTYSGFAILRQSYE